jgi:hypothetical protein
MPSRNYIRTPVGNSPFVMPAGALEAKFNDFQKAYRLKIPAVFCTFIIKMDSPMPAGSKLEISYIGPQKPWLITELKPIADNPNAGYVTLTHEHIINPPFWEIAYKLVVRSGDGVERYNTIIRLWKTLPEKCWDGSYPDPVTMWCPVNDG